MFYPAMENTPDTILLAKESLPVTENYNSRQVLKKKKNVKGTKIGHILEQNIKICQVKKRIRRDSQILIGGNR